MKRALLCWELGGDYGHLGRFLPLALALRQRGIEPIFVLRDLSLTEGILGKQQFRLFQAPLWLTAVTGLPAAMNYSETLLLFGFFDAAGLTGICRAWRHLIDALSPSLLVFDHAPTALLATTGLPIPRVIYGDGFCAPPRVDPFPPYRWWLRRDQTRLADTTQRVLAVANHVLADLGAPPLAQLSELHAVDESFLMTLAELDHYAERPAARYLGPVFGLGSGADPAWPAFHSGKKVFAYIKPGYRDFDKVLQALAGTDAGIVIHAPGTSLRTMKTFESAQLTFSVAPVDMERARAECDVAICHAGVGTVSAMLLAGKPLLLLPMQTEQLMLAKRVEQLGAGLVANLDHPAPDYRKLLKRLLNEAGFANAAQGISSRYRDLDPAAQIDMVAGRCGQIIGQVRA